MSSIAAIPRVDHYKYYPTEVQFKVNVAKRLNRAKGVN